MSEFRNWKIGAPTRLLWGYGLQDYRRTYGRTYPASAALWWPVFERFNGKPDAAPIAYVLEDRRKGIAGAHELIDTMRAAA